MVKVERGGWMEKLDFHNKTILRSPPPQQQQQWGEEWNPIMEWLKVELFNW